MEDTSKMRVIVKPTGFSYGVRNDSGFQCLIPTVYHYTGQDSRYEKELAEAKEKAYLFAAARDLLASLVALLEQDRVKVSAIESGPNSILNDVLREARAAIAKATIIQQ